MGGACGTYGGEDKSIWRFGEETWNKKNHLEEVDTDGLIILILILKQVDGRM